jgi:hypothetical protein
MTSKSCTDQQHSTCMESGFCAVHNVEIERRKNLETLTANIPKILTITNRMLGYSLLLVVILAGGFAYTTIVSQRSESADKNFQERLDRVSTQISELAKAVAVTEARHDNLVDQLRELNKNLDRDFRARTSETHR